MRFLTEAALDTRFRELIAGSINVEVAVAWITDSDAATLLCAFGEANPGKLRVICGVNGYLTSASVLSRLNGCSDLRIAYGTSGKKFHSKMVIFHQDSKTTSWVGSANLTPSAFSTNRELVWEISEDDSPQKQFESYWKEFRSSKPSDDWLAQYSELSIKVSKPPAVPQMSPPNSNILPSMSWAEYVAALKWRNEKRMEHIRDHLPIVKQIALADWAKISKSDAEKLLGLEPGFGGLGRLKSAGVVKNIFFESTPENLRIRQALHDAIDGIPEPSAPNFAFKLTEALDKITKFNRVGIGTASRLLAVRYPDRFISVNGESKDRLSAITGIAPARLMKSAGYVELVQWLTSQSWWTSEMPQEDTAIWINRAALIDVLAYRGRPTEDMQVDPVYKSDEE